MYVCGSDEHVPITLELRQKNIRPQDVVDKYHGIMKDIFRIGISMDVYHRTSDGNIMKHRFFKAL